MADFLFEIGLEEVPARMIAGASIELSREVREMLVNEQLIEGSIKEGFTTFGAPNSKSFATPRRLALVVEGIRERQEDVTTELMGPAVKIAYKDGAATPAAMAFAKKAGVEVSALKTVDTPKGEYLAATVVRAGRTAAEVIAAEMPKILAEIYWAKNMYWRAGRPERFVRPVRWMVAMLGEKIVPVEFGGYVAESVTYGHRVLFGEQKIGLKSPGAYEDALLGGFVVADVEVRRQKIRKALDKVTRAGDPEGVGLRWREDHELVDKLTQLTEWPSVLLGGFEKEYLALPEEVLVTVMRDHQNYFAVEDRDGKLAPYFLAVLNTEADEAGVGVIRHGNERVLRARFNDARFFWEFDQRVPLRERVALLENVTFQKDLGSYFAKTERVRALAKFLYETALNRGLSLNEFALDEAAQLAKADLTCELVKEFTELQGVVGGLYARAQGHSEAVALAISDQYKPESMEDSIPKTMEGALLAIADKADTIGGMFTLGLEPTGSRDPFALRRAGNGIVKILAETVMPLTLDDMSELVTLVEAADKVDVFLRERLEFYLREARRQTYDVVKAVLAAGASDVRDAVARAEAVTAVRASADFAAVCLAFKRMKNILVQAREKGYVISSLPDKLSDPAEIALYQELQLRAAVIENLSSGRDYKGALIEIAKFGPLLHDFFEKVMVLTEESEVRASRLSLVQKVFEEFSRIGDFSEIVVVG